MTRLVCLLDGLGLLVDAPVQRPGPEERPLGAAFVEDVHQRASVLVRAVVVGQREHPRVGALGDHHARIGRPLHPRNGVDGRVCQGRGRGGGCQKQGQDLFAEHHSIMCFPGDEALTTGRDVMLF